jgi:hypothetical protein
MRIAVLAAGRSLGLAVALLALSVPAWGLEVRVETELLETIAPEQKRFRAVYTLSDVDLDPAQGIVIRFDPAGVSSLEVPAGDVPLAWDRVVVQPDRHLPDYGLLDLRAQSALSDASAVFELRFVWSGPGDPELPAFSVYDTDLRNLTAGIVVPEPGVAVSSLVSLAALAVLGRRRRP